LTNELAAKQALAIKKLADKNEKEGKAFLANNKNREGIITLNSGLQYKIITSGKGKKPVLTDKVECHYRGTLIDGTEFDSSYRYGKPAIFSVTDVILGLRDALQLMPVGSKWQLFILPDLAYGERGAGTIIGPNTTLIFEMDLLGITVPGAVLSPEKTAAKPTPSQLPAFSATVPQDKKELPPAQQQQKVKVIANKDSKRYHLPGMQYYDQVKSFHMVEFDSEDDAIKAGYRKAPK
jgi:FKBP-type peptidyl-prolyl cis-trans isomerase